MSSIEKIIPSAAKNNYYIKNTPASKVEKPVETVPVQNMEDISDNDDTPMSNSNRILMYLAGIGVITAAGIYLVKRRGAAKNVVPVQQNGDKPIQNVSAYITELAEGLSTFMKEKISPERLSSVMDKTEFLEAVSKLKRDNYVLTKENVDAGIYRADLHSHTNFSDGRGSVEHIMDQAAQYADKLFKKTGEKFIFALTDHDTADSSKEALKLIANNPEKFKNVRFVVGSEVSYLMKSSDKTANPYETTELLIYGFNPFSKKVETFFKDVLNRRLQARKDYIRDLSEKFPDTKFSEEEFLNVFLGDRVPHTPILNSYWQLYHYGQIKRELSCNAVFKNLNPEEYFRECMKNAPEKLYFSEFKNRNIIESWVGENQEINKINEKYKPHNDESGNIVKTSENTLDDIVTAFKDEPNCVAGFAHPYYIGDRTNNVDGLLNEVQSKLRDMLKVTESYHQAYSSELLRDKAGEISRISDMCESKGLIPIGGRDNHTADFIWSSYLN